VATPGPNGDWRRWLGVKSAWTIGPGWMYGSYYFGYVKVLKFGVDGMVWNKIGILKSVFYKYAIEDSRDHSLQRSNCLTDIFEM
jgi:hypothetical protein